MLMALMILTACLAGCSSRDTLLNKSDSNQNAVNVIALMPVENKTQDARISQLLRVRLLEELRFKGYSQIAVDAPDATSVPASVDGNGAMPGVIKPGTMKEAGQADAALYCTLRESKLSTTLFYAPATVAVSCELRSTKTGETIWDAKHKSTSRSFDLMNSKMKSSGALESALEDVVGKIMETLPYGPKLRG